MAVVDHCRLSALISETVYFTTLSQMRFISCRCCHFAEQIAHVSDLIYRASRTAVTDETSTTSPMLKCWGFIDHSQRFSSVCPSVEKSATTVFRLVLKSARKLALLEDKAACVEGDKTDAKLLIQKLYRYDNSTVVKRGTGLWTHLYPVTREVLDDECTETDKVHVGVVVTEIPKLNLSLCSVGLKAIAQNDKVGWDTSERTCRPPSGWFLYSAHAPAVTVASSSWRTALPVSPIRTQWVRQAPLVRRSSCMETSWLADSFQSTRSEPAIRFMMSLIDNANSRKFKKISFVNG